MESKSSLGFMAPRKLIGQHATHNRRVHVAEGAYTSEDGTHTRTTGRVHVCAYTFAGAHARLETRTNGGAYCDWGAYTSGGRVHLWLRRIHLRPGRVH